MNDSELNWMENHKLEPIAVKLNYSDMLLQFVLIHFLYIAVLSWFSRGTHRYCVVWNRVSNTNYHVDYSDPRSAYWSTSGTLSVINVSEIYMYDKDLLRNIDTTRKFLNLLQCVKQSVNSFLRLNSTKLKCTYAWIL